MSFIQLATHCFTLYSLWETVVQFFKCAIMLSSYCLNYARDSVVFGFNDGGHVTRYVTHIGSRDRPRDSFLARR
jgi:hypothetical protein